MKQSVWTLSHQDLDDDCGPLVGTFSLSYVAETFVDEHSPNLSSIEAEINLHVSLWSMPTSRVWLNSEANPFETAVNIGKEVTDSLFKVLGQATGLAQVLSHVEESKALITVPKRITLDVTCEVEPHFRPVIHKASLEEPKDQYFWSSEIRKHRLQTLAWATVPSETKFSAIYH